MQRIVIHGPGGYDKLLLESAPDPVPGPGEILVKTAAIGVNYADCCVRWGVYESARLYVGWPITPGFEFSGCVAAVGAGVTAFAIGDRVFGVTRFNGYASHIVVPAHQLWPLPAGFTFEQAAGFPAVFFTAYHALYHSATVRAGMSVLIHSAAGGVGSALVQLARQAGCRVVGVVGAPHKVEAARRAGCDVVIEKSQDKLWPAAEAAAPDGFDIICDANGPATLKDSYHHLRPTGRLVVYGFHTMLPKTGGRLNYAKAALGLLRVPRLSPFSLVSDNKGVVGFNLSFLFDRTDLLAEGVERLLAWVAAGQIVPPETRSFPLAEVAAAHRAIESAQTTGKLILVP